MDTLGPTEGQHYGNVQGKGGEGKEEEEEEEEKSKEKWPVQLPGGKVPDLRPLVQVLS